MVEWLKSKLTIILIICLLGCGTTIFFMKLSINSKNKKIEALELQVKGFKLQIDITNAIITNDRILYAKKKKLLEELFIIGNDVDKLVSFLNRLYNNNN